MKPKETGLHYDKIASWWQEHHLHSTYGVAALEKAIKFTETQSSALDVGCGSSGRFIDVYLQNGFTPEGVDVSAEMISLASQLHPEVKFFVGDICTWDLPRKYDLISAWDSTFHLPISEQKPVLKKLCDGLNPEGIIIFTCGGSIGAHEISGGFQGESFEYSTLGVEEFLRLIIEFGCLIKHVEYDLYPENHVYIIGQKVNSINATDQA